MIGKKDKFWFMNVWYPSLKVREVACQVTNMDESKIQTEDDLGQLVEDIVKGPPTSCSTFILGLTGSSK